MDCESHQRLIGQSPAFVEQVEKIPLLAGCDVGVMIRGETGTGKEVIARAIHSMSPRARGPFVPINCGAIPQELVENELFGHERGAFTGAESARAGLIEEAAGGTLLLDEVDSLPLLAQVKLLRFLQEKEYRRLGSTKTRVSDLRVIAATNAEVETAVEDGRLRQDLYYRLNVVPLSLPPLRQRREDITPLARHFLERYARQFKRSVDGFSARAIRAMLDYDWPGNVRELEHVVQRAMVFCVEGAIIRRQHVTLPESKSEGLGSFQNAKARVVASFEQSYIEKLLAAHQGNISSAAREAKKNRRAFWELLRKHKVDASRFRPAEMLLAG